MNYFWLSDKEVRQIVDQFGSPLYIYDELILKNKIEEIQTFSLAFGLTVRYAMKANSTSWILKYFNEGGIEFDASSGFEAERALMLGIPAEKIMLTSQELPDNFENLIHSGIKFNASSLYQLQRFADSFSGYSLGIRINPGIGSGHNNRTNVGGPNSSFGIWHEYLNLVNDITEKYNLNIYRLHIHIGSGFNSDVWQDAVDRMLTILPFFPNVKTLNLGGGFRVARMPGEINANLKALMDKTAVTLKQFYKDSGRKIHLEIEPGTWLTAQSGILLTQISDIVDTGQKGHTFFRLNSGMTELTRPTLYGVQHPTKHISNSDNIVELNELKAVVVGHCCESGDILTPDIGNPESFVPLDFINPKIGDIVLFGVAGAYCSSMSLTNYNSFPKVAEILRSINGQFKLIRKRQTLKQMIENDILD